MALNRGELWASCLGHFTSGGWDSSTHWIWGWVGPRAILDSLEKKVLIRPARNESTWPCLSAHNVVTTLTMHILQYIHNRQYFIQQTKGGQAVTHLACLQECLFRISAWSLIILKFLRLSTVASEKSSAVNQITSQLLPSSSFTFPYSPLIIQCHTVWTTENTIKKPQNKWVNT
jgi:hypothetical protein